LELAGSIKEGCTGAQRRTIGLEELGIIMGAASPRLVVRARAATASAGEGKMR